MKLKTGSRFYIQLYAIVCVIILCLVAAGTALGQEDRTLPQATPPKSKAQDDDPLNSTRINSIDKRIELLRKILQEEAEQKSKRSSQPEGFPPTPPISPLEPTADTSAEDPNNEFVPTLPINELPTKPIETVAPVPAAPVDSFELGNSLFMTVNYKASIKSYKIALDLKKPEDEAWLRCLMGCSFRLSGDYQKAEVMFRKVSDRRDPESYPADHARWSLSHIEKRRKSYELFSAIENEINALSGGAGNESN